MPIMSEATPPTDVSAKPPRRFRRLRIAVSVFFGVLAVALCVLWVRSYWFFEYVLCPTIATKQIELVSYAGRVGAAILSGRENRPFGWGLASNRIVPDGDADARWARNAESMFSHLADASVLKFNAQRISLPYWRIVGVAAGFAAFPWIRLRFSLRTLLIAMTLFAVVLGLVCYAVQ